MMTLRKLLTATVILTASSAASADFIGIYAGAERWNYDMDGYVGSGSENINLNDDLGLKDSDDNTYYVAFEHPIPFLPNIKIQQNNLKGNGNGIASQDFTFNTRDFSQGDDVLTNYDLSHIDYTLYYEILDNWVNLDLGLTGKQFDGHIVMDYAPDVVSIPNNGTVNFKGTIPAVYGKAQFDLPFTGLSTGTTLNIGEKSGDKMSDVKAYLAYEGDSGFGVELGYRVFNLEFDNFDNLSSDISFDGFYAGFTLHL